MMAAALAGCSRPLTHRLYFLVPPGGSQGGSQTSRNMLFLQRVLGLLPDGRAGSPSKGSRSEGILIRCPDHFSWFLPKEQQLCSELPILSQRLSPAALQRNLIFSRFLYPQPGPFSRCPEFMAIGEGWNIG